MRINTNSPNTRFLMRQFMWYPQLRRSMPAPVCLVGRWTAAGNRTRYTVLYSRSSGNSRHTTITGRHFRAIIPWQRAAASDPASQRPAAVSEAKIDCSRRRSTNRRQNLVRLPQRQMDKTPMPAAVSVRKPSDSKFQFRWPRLDQTATSGLTSVN